MPPLTPSLEPLSPQATHTVMPSVAAAWNASSMAVFACEVQVDSAPPQLIDVTDGLLVASCMAVVTASRKPASVFGAKYTAILACGAMAPTTSTSSITSPSGPPAPPVGALAAPSTATAATVGLGSPKAPKYSSRSAGAKPPPSSMRATHWPAPSPFGKPYKAATCGGV